MKGGDSWMGETYERKRFMDGGDGLWMEVLSRWLWLFRRDCEGRDGYAYDRDEGQLGHAQEGKDDRVNFKLVLMIQRAAIASLALDPSSLTHIMSHAVLGDSEAPNQR